MSARKASTRILSMLLVLCMVIGMVPMGAFAAEDDTLAASLEEAKSFIDGITINNSSNDPETVVKNFKTHFTWDNEKRENSKSYLFDWSYYNGVVFEGIEYLYEVTGDTKYKDYVVEYMSSLIASNGTWAKCSNNSSKECAGYNSTHGADCYKTASLLLDAYEMTGDNRYLTVAETLYADLDTAAKSYSLKNAGNNFRHTWASDPSPDLWLDGLYMILPFRAEYAKYIGDTEELDLIVSRMQWVSDNMYNSSKGLFYHAADSASSNSGNYWLRAMGWYAAAIVDVMDSMSGENFTAMQKQLVKFVDGMKKNQNASNGMWKNNVLESESTKNPYETSGTALVCYAVMKAVNNGWLDESYADMALLAFNGIVNEKLDGDTLNDICFKGTPGSGNEQFEPNEGKGVGPFIMFYAEVLEYYNNQVVSISVTAPTKTEYEVGETLSTDGMTVTATTRGGKTYPVTGYTVSGVDMSEAGTKTVTVTYGDLTASFEITVVEPETEAPVTEQTFTVYPNEADVIYITATAESATADWADNIGTVAELVEEDYTAYTIGLTGHVEGTAVAVEISLALGYDEDTLKVYYVDAEGNVTDVTESAEVYTSSEGFQSITVKDALVGTYVYGTELVKVEENATLTGLAVTQLPEKTAYFVEEARAGVLPLDIAGLIVTATFSDGTEKELEWDEFGDVEDGYSISVDMTKLGKQDVILTYTYGEVTLTTSYEIEIFEKAFSGGETGVVIAPSVPGVTEVKVTENTTDESVVEALAEKVEKFVAYDIVLTGYNQGDKVTLTLPVPEGFDTNRLVGVSIEDGEVKLISGTYDAETNTFSFVTDHFSTKAIAEITADEIAWKEIPGETKTVFRLTNSLSSGKKHLIVSSDDAGTANALSVTYSNRQYSVSSTSVNIIADNDGNYIEAPAESAQWTYTSGSKFQNVSYTGRYLRGNNTSLTTTTSTSDTYTTWSFSNGLRVRQSSYSSTYRYLRSDFTTNTSSSTSNRVYIFVEDEIATESTYAGMMGTTAYEITSGDYANSAAVIAMVKENLTVYTADDSNGTNKKETSDYSITGTVDPDEADTYTLTVTYEGTTLGTVSVTILDKEIVNKELTGNSQINVTLNETPDYSNIKYIITYDDDSTAEITAENGLTFGACDTSTSGKKTVDIFYNNQWIGEVVVNVTVDFSKLDPATSYPEYPNDGAVRIDKTATHNAEEFNRTGVTHVELDVAGISVESAVDVILIMDISNSMSWDDSEYDYNDTTITSGSNQRLNIARDSAKEFVNELMKDNGDDDPETVDNTITMLAFAGIDGDYNDHSTARANDDVYQVGELAMDTITEANAALDTLVKATTGGTNYDYAFQQAYELAEQLHNERGNRVYIVFMTDGVPTHYNGVYYKSRNNTDLTALMNYVDPATGEESRYTSTGYDRAGNDIDATASMPITVYYNNGTTANKTVTYNKGWSDYVVNNKNGWAEKVKALDYVAHVYCIGFGMKNGSVVQGATSSMPTLNNVNGGQYYLPSSTTHALLQHIATDANSHFEADDKEELTKLYQTLATQIKFAGTEARVTDTVGNNFSVQMAPYVVDKDGNQIALATAPTITIKTYDLYARGSTDAEGNDITGERTGVSNDIEIVTFNDDGTEAYSSVIGEGINILTTDASGNITINAKYFTYTKTAATSEETFVWNIGNITDKEIALTFDAYLEGSMSGQRPEDVYYTNEEGIVEYVDINGDYAKQTFPRPGVAWGGATTTIRFYLVNEKGEPVNRDGDVIPWANRVYVGDPVIVTLNLNGEMEIEAQKIEAAAHVPSGFFLYDNNAYYIVETTSSTEAVVGGITVSDPSDDAHKTTGTAPEAVTQTGAQTTRVIAYEDPYYTWSIVGFGVRWDLTAEKADYVLVSDQVVIDYGKEIQMDVLANDPVREGYTREITGFIKYSAGTDLNYIQQNAGSATFSGAEYGTFTIVDGKVQCQPTEILNGVQKVFYAVRYTETANTENTYIVWGQLDVIPATIMYYETDFADVFKTTGTWTPDKTVEGDNVADGPQNYVAIEADDLYGADSTYNNDKYLSNGSSYFVMGQGVDATYVDFSFTGTGFDLISRTGTEQGAIRVDVYSDAARTTRIKSVTVLNKSESSWELYQIPVASIEMDAHGTYYVTVRVSQAYENEKFPVLTRGAEFYFDAIRVYNPIVADSSVVGSDAAIAYAAYNADGELNPQIVEVRNVLLDKETFNTANQAINGITFGEVIVDRGQSNVDVATYETIGPNNEVYLKIGQGISFNVETGATAPKTFNIGAKSVNGGTVVLEATIFKNGAQVNKVTTTNIISSTIQFITLLEMDKVDPNAVYQVVITNRGAGVLSVTDLKFAGSSAADDVELYSDTISVEKMKQVLVYGAPKAEEEIETPDFGVVSAEFTADNAKRGETVTMVITTSEDVASIAVKNSNGSDEAITVKSIDIVNGVKVWTVTFKVTGAGDLTYTAVGYNTDGVAGTAASDAIEVTIR